MVFPVKAESVVAVASKNANSGEIPAARVNFAFRFKLPLVAEQDERLIATVAALCVVPPDPVQLKEYVVECMRAPVLWVPLVDFAPVQPPEAVQVLAAVVDHVIIELPPLLIDPGVAVMVTTGPAAAVVEDISLPESALVDAALAVAASPLGAAPEEPHAVNVHAAQHTIARRTTSLNERNCKLMHICRFPSRKITLNYRSNTEDHSWCATVPIDGNCREIIIWVTKWPTVDVASPRRSSSQKNY